MIQQHLEKTLKYTEIHQYINFKLMTGFFTAVFTVLSVYHVVPFPSDIWIIVLCIIGYHASTTSQWLYEKYVEKQTFLLIAPNDLKGDKVAVSSSLPFYTN